MGRGEDIGIGTNENGTAAARFSDGAGLAGRQERAYLSACAAELAARTFALRETSALYGVFAAVSV